MQTGGAISEACAAWLLAFLCSSWLALACEHDESHDVDFFSHAEVHDVDFFHATHQSKTKRYILLGNDFSAFYLLFIYMLLIMMPWPHGSLTTIAGLLHFDSVNSTFIAGRPFLYALSKIFFLWALQPMCHTGWKSIYFTLDIGRNCLLGRQLSWPCQRGMLHWPRQIFKAVAAIRGHCLLPLHDINSGGCSVRCHLWGDHMKELDWHRRP